MNLKYRNRAGSLLSKKVSVDNKKSARTEFVINIFMPALESSWTADPLIFEFWCIKTTKSSWNRFDETNLFTAAACLQATWTRWPWNRLSQSGTERNSGLCMTFENTRSLYIVSIRPARTYIYTCSLASYYDNRQNYTTPHYGGSKSSVMAFNIHGYFFLSSVEHKRRRVSSGIYLHGDRSFRI